MHKYLSGRDTFIRHRCLSMLADRKDVDNILDVGGEGSLSMFIPGKKILTVNINGAMVIASGMKLPFKSKSFDAVVSADTLEHISKKDRACFLEELQRIARKCTIICAPLGTERHIEHEKIVYENQNMDGTTRKYLGEHIRFGLPTPEEVANMVSQNNGEIFYQGDFQKVTFRINNKYPQILLNLLSNIIMDIIKTYKKELMREYTQYSNRFYLIINK